MLESLLAALRRNATLGGTSNLPLSELAGALEPTIAVGSPTLMGGGVGASPPPSAEPTLNINNLLAALGPMGLKALMGGLGGPPQLPERVPQLPPMQLRPVPGRPIAPVLSSTLAALLARGSR